MINHHPEDELLLGLAAGRLDGGQTLLVSVHLEGCATCRGRLNALQAIGGELLATVEPRSLSPRALAETFERIDAPAQTPAASLAPIVHPAHPALPDHLRWPASMRRCSASPWHWVGPGMHWSRQALPFRSPGALFLLRIAPGRSLPRHTHSGVELTQVLYGTFDDGRARFGPGDFDATDEDVHHQPFVQAGSECVCLAHIGGRLRFDGWIATTIGRVIGM
jgi:putative transcriptional regulator